MDEYGTPAGGLQGWVSGGTVQQNDLMYQLSQHVSMINHGASAPVIEEFTASVATPTSTTTATITITSTDTTEEVTTVLAIDTSLGGDARRHKRIHCFS